MGRTVQVVIKILLYQNLISRYSGLRIEWNSHVRCFSNLLTCPDSKKRKTEYYKPFIIRRLVKSRLLAEIELEAVRLVLI